MANEPVFVGIELGTNAIRVVASGGGQRSTISGARHQSPAEWFELALYGLACPPSRPLYAAVAVAADTRDDEREAIIEGARSARFAGAFVCVSPWALARGAERQEAAVAVIVDPRASSLAVVRGGEPCALDQDTVRPIAGREARELAIAVRCLLKRHPRDLARRLLANVVVAGDEAELDRIGRQAIFRELDALGATTELVGDPFAAAMGAERLAFELEDAEWDRLMGTTSPIV